MLTSSNGAESIQEKIACQAPPGPKIDLLARRTTASQIFCEKLGGGSPALRNYAETGFGITNQPNGQGAAMPEQERVDAIKRFQAHEVEAYRRSVEWDGQRKEDLAKWKSATLTMIYQSVQRVSDDFAVRGSPFLFSSIPMQPECSAAFRVKTTSGGRLFAKLHFDLANGQVMATSTVDDAHFPSSVAVKDVAREWVEIAAERVLIAMLNAASNPLPEHIPSSTAQSGPNESKIGVSYLRLCSF